MIVYTIYLIFILNLKLNFFPVFSPEEEVHKSVNSHVFEISLAVVCVGISPEEYEIRIDPT